MSLIEIKDFNCNSHPSFKNESHWYSLIKDGQELVDINIYLGHEGEFHILVTNGNDGQNRLPNEDYDSVVAEIKMKFADFEKKQEEGE
tara:strand:+ start:185 stop:448 length:264 start_codon:yes stop_codon:yes gene_type:complete